MTSTAPIIPGTAVGRFRIVSEIGSGGMGTVYRADVLEPVAGLAVGDAVALKIVHPHLLAVPGFFKRFLREGEVGRRVRHPNVVATFDLDGIRIGEETVLYMAMELVEGKTLWQLFQELGPVPEALGRHLAGEIAKGLQSIHELGFVHRDVKPENILVGSDRSVKLMDLGVARMIDDDIRLSKTGSFVGSALYAAPEQFRDDGKDLDGRVDLYALGAVLYELVSGTPPHDAEDFAKIVGKVLTENPRPLREACPQVSPYFAEVVHALLHRDREQRIASATELLAILADGEESPWWKARAQHAATATGGPLRRLNVVRHTALVGREKELSVLREALRSAKGSAGRVVLVEGEAGIGKTRLVDEFVAGIAERGELVHFLFGSYPLAGANGATAAFDEALREFVHEGPAAEQLLVRHVGATPAIGLAAHLRAGLANGEPMKDEAFLATLLAFLRSLAAERPTILFVDSLQFAQSRGLALFAGLAAAVERDPVLVVAAARPGLPEEWVANLAVARHVQRMPLTRLGIKDAARLVVAAAGSEARADDLGFEAVEKSGGNPYFLLELVRSMLSESETDPGAPAPRERETLRLPSSVVELLKARIAALSDEDRDLLQLAACCGVEFDPRLVGDAIGADRLAVLKRLTRIERVHRMVHAVGERFVFDHRGLFDALRAEIPDALEREYSASLASALEQRLSTESSGSVDASSDGERAASLAELCLRAGEPGRAAGFLQLGLAHLDQRHDVETAASLAARALAAPGLVDGAERMEMLLAQGARLELLGRIDAARDAVTEALETAILARDMAAHARALVAYGRCRSQVARYDEALSSLEEAIYASAQIGDAAVEAEAHAVRGAVYRECARYEEAFTEHKAQLGLRRALGDADGEAAAWGDLGAVHCELGQYDHAYSCFKRERELGRADGDRLARLRMKLHVGRALAALGRFDDARSQFARALTIAELARSARGRTSALASLGEVAFAMGDLALARRHLTTAANLARGCGLLHLQGRAVHGLSAVTAADGERRTAIEHARSALELRRSIGDRAGVVDSLVVLGRLRVACGATEAGRLAFGEAMELARSIGRSGGHVLAAAHLALLPRGDPESAKNALRAYETRIAMDHRIEAHSLLWRATGASEHITEARQLLDHVLTHVPAELRVSAAARLTNGMPVTIA